ncbi:unnamed protein product (macronuclear) [Paramecium tetraurelia]|uniref:Transmembrane protein n=1 Tax=Paramecium tetraurelia TaxID=5888 RepID=A0C4R8_PARTE|nr:uncharacterized protein GSPATT00006284001 [Paramecium tetraurelia]CAK65785.1 unnamed protein product [Paramecium tetraurelia]|eukprot:XP_001433182.1 hypothetical protein (macronuclear) [Paramecium tetraurelia strain d4-2]
MANRLKKLQLFYVNEFYRIYNKIRRNKSNSIMLFIIQHFQLFYLLHQSFTNLFKNNSRPLVLINYICQYITLDFNSENFVHWNEIFLIAIFIGQLLLVLSLLLLLLQQKVEDRSNKQDLQNQLILLKNLGLEKAKFRKVLIIFIQNLEYYVSFFIKISIHLLNCPIMYLAMKEFKLQLNQEQNSYAFGINMQLISLLVIIFNQLIISYYEVHNNQFSFKQKDYLTYCSSVYTKLQTYLLQFLLFLISLINNLNMDVIIANLINISLLIPIFNLSIKHPKYDDQTSNYMHIQTFSILLLVNLIVLIFSQILNLEFSEIILMISPLAFYVTHLKIQQESLIQQADFNQRIRSLYNQCHTAIGKNGMLIDEVQYRLPKDLRLYVFSTNHFINCQNKPQCFCHQYRVESGSFISRLNFKNYLKNLIRLSFEENLKGKNLAIENDFTTNFYYILYISQISKQPAKAFYELTKLKIQSEKSMKLLNKMYLNSIEQYVKDDFNKMIELKNITNQKYICFKVFYYDIAIKLWKQQFIASLKQQKNWYSLIQNRNIIELIKDGKQLQNKNKELEKSLKYLFKQNPISPECSLLISLFYKYIYFNHKKIEIPSLDSQLVYKFQNSNNGILFLKDAALVYLTLVDTKGIIKNYTKTFKQAVYASDSQILNNSINDFIPKIIAKVHDQFLDNFVEQGRIHIMKSEKRFLLVKNKKGFIFPIIAKVRLETNLFNDFGSSALILPANNNYHYILLNYYGLIEEISEKLFTQVFQPILRIDLDQLQNIDCLKLIPKLIKTWKNMNSNKILDPELKDLIQSYLVIPKKLKKQNMLTSTVLQINQTIQEFLKDQDKINEKYFQNMKEMFMFRINFRIIEFYTFQGTIYCIEIQNIKTVKQSQRLDIYYNIIEKSDYSHISFKKIKTIQEKNEKIKLQQKVLEKSTYKDTFGFIKLQNDSQTLCNLEADKIVEDDYMIKQKEMQIQLVNPLYQYEIENNSHLVSQSNSQGKKQIEQQAQKMQSSITHNLYTFNNFNSNLSNPLSQLFSQDQNKYIVHSSAVLEGLNENRESIKSLNSLDVPLSEENGFFEMEQLNSVSSSQVSHYKLKKNQIKHNLFDQNSKLHRLIRIINVLIFIILIVCNIWYFYHLNQQNQFISQSLRNYAISNSFNIRINQFILSYELESTQLFNYSQYSKFCSSQFQQDISFLYYYFPNLVQTTVPFISINAAQNITNQSFYQSLGYISQYLLSLSNGLNEQYYLEIIARNFIMFSQQIKFFNSTGVQLAVDEFYSSQSDMRSVFYITLLCVFLVTMFYLIILIIILRAKHKIMQLFHTFPKSQMVALIGSIEIILHFLDYIDFINHQTTDQLLEQVKQKIASSPGMMKILQLNAVQKNQQNQDFSKSSNLSQILASLIYVVYTVSLVFIYFLIASQYIGQFIYQTEFESTIIDLFEQLVLYKSSQIYVLEFQSFQKLLIQYEQLKQNDILFLNKSNKLCYLGDEALIYMENQLSIFQEFIQRMNNQKTYQISGFKGTLTSESCQAFSLLIQSQNNDADYFNEYYCRQLDSLRSGLIVQLVNLSQNFKQLFIISHDNLQQFNEYLDSISKVNLEDQIQNLLYTSQILSLLHDSIQYESEIKLQNNRLIHLLLFIFGLISYLIFIFISNNKLKVYLYNELVKTKQLFLLIPLDVLCENPYILQLLAERIESSQN